MKNVKRLVASEVISRLCDEMNYTRGHVANVMRRHQDRLRMVRAGRRWRIPESSVPTLRSLVAQSGPRYKLGERLA